MPDLKPKDIPPNPQEDGSWIIDDLIADADLNPFEGKGAELWEESVKRSEESL